MSPSKNPAESIIKVELIFIAPLVGRQTITKKITPAGNYDFTAAGGPCNRERVYTLLLSAGIPPGHPWHNILLSEDTDAPAAEKSGEPAQNQEDSGDTPPSRTYIAVTFDNKSRKLYHNEDTLTFVKQTLPGACTYFINRIQCRAKDIREMFTGAGIKQGHPAYEVLLKD